MLEPSASLVEDDTAGSDLWRRGLLLKRRSSRGGDRLENRASHVATQMAMLRGGEALFLNQKPETRNQKVERAGGLRAVLPFKFLVSSFWFLVWGLGLSLFMATGERHHSEISSALVEPMAACDLRRGARLPNVPGRSTRVTRRSHHEQTPMRRVCGGGGPTR